MKVDEYTLQNWFAHGKECNAAYMLIILDPSDEGLFPYYAYSTDDAHNKIETRSQQGRGLVQEVYDLAMPQNAQIRTGRTWNLPGRTAPKKEHLVTLMLSEDEQEVLVVSQSGKTVIHREGIMWDVDGRSAAIRQAAIDAIREVL